MVKDWLKSASLYERLKKYGETDDYPFHMPGHKRREMKFDNPFEWDLTEIDGFDDLHHPEGILKDAMEGAAAVYQSDAVYFLVNGSSCGILAAVSGAVSPGERILMARNCHKSVYHGVLVNRLEARYLYPEILEDFSCAGGITPKQVEEALEQDRERKIRCVVITSPTYEGLVSDVGKIAEAVHRHGAVLIVDEAHGAHFPFHSFFPVSALALEADVVIQSLHKTLPSLTQTALLHIKGDRIDRNRVETYLSVYQSSSPSYVLLASIDQCIRYMAGSRGRETMENYVNSLRELRQRLAGLEHIKLLDEQVVGSCGIYGLDQGKLVLSAGEAGMSGKELYRHLKERWHLQPEMCTDAAVTLMTSVNDSRQGFSRLAEAVRELDQELEKGKGTDKKEKKKNERIWKPSPAAAGITAAQAFAASYRLVPLEKSPGQTAACLVCPYPPGIPVLVPGEEITEQCAAQIRRYLDQNMEVHGLQKKENIFFIPVVS